MKIKITQNGELCPACGEGHLSSHVERESVTHHGIRGEIMMHYSTCDSCGSELVGEAESKANKREIALFRKSAEGLLSGTEIKKIRRKLGLTQALAAALFGGGKVGFSRYESDDVTQSAAMDSLLRLCSAKPENLLLLAQHKKLDIPRSVSHRIDPTFVKIEECLAILNKWINEKDQAKLIGQSKPMLAVNDYFFHNSESNPRAEVYSFKRNPSCNRAH
jgi:HTH-type transcriptional regulator/antitoxin MqsA